MSDYHYKEKHDFGVNSFSDLQQMAIATGDCKEHIMRSFSFSKPNMRK